MPNSIKLAGGGGQLSTPDECNGVISQASSGIKFIKPSFVLYLNLPLVTPSELKKEHFEHVITVAFTDIIIPFHFICPISESDLPPVMTPIIERVLSF